MQTQHCYTVRSVIYLQKLINESTVFCKYEGESIINRNAVAFVFLLAALSFRVHR
jgi:hypothetical protein